MLNLSTAGELLHEHGLAAARAANDKENLPVSIGR